MIKNENDFIGYLISVKDAENNIDINHVLKFSGLSNLDVSKLVKDLESKDYAVQLDTCTLHLYPWGVDAYMSNRKRILIWMLKLLVLTIKNLVLFVGGILSGLIVAYGTFLINKLL